MFGEVYRGALEPAAGATVTLDEPGAVARVVVADERGRYRFDALPDGCRGMIRASLSGLAPATAQLMPLAQGEVRRLDPLTLTTAIRVTCRVLSIRDEPIEGARVEAYSQPVRAMVGALDDRLDCRDVPLPAATRTTGTDGVAQFDGLGAANWTFVARRSGFVDSAAAYRDLRESVEKPVELHLTPGVRLEGRVVDGSGRPLPGVVVWAGGMTSGWIDPSGSPAARPRAVSDADGRFAFDALPTGETMLWVSRLGATRVEYGTVRIPHHGEYVVVLDGARIEGTVLDGDSGAPVPGAVVSGLTCGKHRRGTRSFSVVRVVADASGKYAIDTMTSADRLNSVVVESSGRMLDPSDPAVGLWPGLVLASGRTTTHDFVLRRTARIVGRVTCDGAPVAGVEVDGREEPYAQSASTRQRRNVRTSTDADGRYVLDGFPPGWMLVGVHDAHFAQTGFPAGWIFWPLERQHALPAYVEIRGSDDIVHDVEVVATTAIAPSPLPASAGEAARVRGVVVGPDGPIAGAIVQAKAHDETYGCWDPDSETCWRSVRPRAADDAGHFDIAFASVKRRRCWIRATAPGFATSKTVFVQDLDDGADTTIRLERAVSIRGRVVLSGTGEPVVGANVGVDEPEKFGQPWSNHVVASVASVTGSDGRFEIDGVAEGEHELLVVAEGCLLARRSVAAPASDEVTIELAPALTIEGQVVCDDGAPAPNFSIVAEPEDRAVPPGGGTTATQSGADGRFRLEPIAAGTYTVSTHGAIPGRSLSRETIVRGVSGGAANVRIVVATAPSISGRVVDSEGAPVAGVAVSAWTPVGQTSSGMGETTSGADGTFALVGLREGDVRIIVVPPSTPGWNGAGYVFHRAFVPTEVVKPSGSRDVVVELARGLTIQGTALSSDGTALRGSVVVADALPKPQLPSCGALVASDGSFTITGLAPGTYRLGLNDPQRPNRPTPLLGGESVEAGARDVELRAPR